MSYSDSEVKAAQKRQAIFGGKMEDYLGAKTPISPLASIVKTVPLKGVDPMGTREIVEAVKAVVAPKEEEQIIMDESGFPIGSIPPKVEPGKPVDFDDAPQVPTAPPLSVMQFTSVKDSGARSSFSTGAVRDTNVGKGRFDLVSPIALKRLAQHYENGAKKYGDRNWEKGIPLWRYMDSAQRHLNDFASGDRSEDHLGAAAWNIFGYIHTEAQIALGNLPKTLAEGRPNG